MRPVAFYLCLFLAIWGGGVLSPARAHFLLNVNIRIIHLVHEAEQTKLLIRLPMAYLVADKLGDEQADGTRVPAPYTTNAIEDGQLVHYLDATALRQDPAGLARILAEGHAFSIDDQRLTPVIGRLRAYPAKQQVPFAYLEEAKSALEGPVYADSFETTYVGDTVIDAELIFSGTASNQSYAIRSSLNPGLPKQDETANIVLDHRGSEPAIFRIRGLLHDPVEISNSALEAVWTFIVEGVRHILEGADHVLFVFCLILGATTLASLAWRITGFTVGHTITLSLGFFGFAPQAPWFIPLVEAGIAASIIYAGVIAILEHERRSTTLITALIGLLHGLGFSFVLKEILQVDAPNLWQSLLAFNIGVEVGQLGIAIITWPLLMLIAHKLPQRVNLLRWMLVAPCVAISSLWVGERLVQLVNAL